MQRLILLFLAGGVGTLSRFALGGLVEKHYGALFPSGTFVVNSLGCLLFGILWGLTEDALALSPSMRAVVFTGFMGAFTTFSTFIFETVNLVTAADWAHAALNCMGQILLGMGLLWLGLWLGKTV